jgi:uncharacterized membrane protein YphA (DoxX/SURF4 family)
MKLRMGHNFYGLSAIAFAIITIVWHQINSLGNISHPVILVYLVALIELSGGLAIQWRRTMKIGAILLAGIFFIFTLYLVPPVFGTPLDYSNWGNFFEELSIAIGGVFVFALTMKSDPKRAAKLAGIAYASYGICVISYSLYQLFYLTYTANLVPKWIPLDQMFWAVTTTIAFALAAIAILSGRAALLASGLLTAMFIGFALLVWLPLCIKDPHNITYWFSNAQTIAAAGSAWIVADFLSQSKIAQSRPIEKHI